MPDRITTQEIDDRDELTRVIPDRKIATLILGFIAILITLLDGGVSVETMHYHWDHTGVGLCHVALVLAGVAFLLVNHLRLRHDDDVALAARKLALSRRDAEARDASMETLRRSLEAVMADTRHTLDRVADVPERIDKLADQVAGIVTGARKHREEGVALVRTALDGVEAKVQAMLATMQERVTGEIAGLHMRADQAIASIEANAALDPVERQEIEARIAAAESAARAAQEVGSAAQSAVAELGATLEEIRDFAVRMTKERLSAVAGQSNGHGGGTADILHLPQSTSR